MLAAAAVARCEGRGRTWKKNERAQARERVWKGKKVNGKKKERL
jgi:hypothetical protein